MQVCARCGAQWRVGQYPVPQCARCGAFLPAPVPWGGPAAPQPAQPPQPARQAPPNWPAVTWVAEPPPEARRDAPTPQPAPTPTPRYEAAPTWGLRDTPAKAVGAPKPTGRVQALAGAAPGILRVVAATYAAAALAELLRYGLLVRNQQVLLAPWMVAVSDTLVWVASVSALVAAVLGVLAGACWLVQARAARFARVGQSDPRPARELLAGCLTPLACLVLPGLYLRELVAARPLAGRAAADGAAEEHLWKWARWWWAAWAVTWLLQALAMLWRDATTLQAQADAVVFAAFANAFAAGVALLTLLVMREVGRLTEVPQAKRWVVAVPS